MNRYPSRNRRKLLGVSVALAAASMLPQGHALGATPPATRVLRIGYQKGLLSILKGRGTLEQRLAPLGAKVEWTAFASGPPQLEAFTAGSIDFGDVGAVPPIFAQAVGAPFVYYGQTVPHPAGNAVIVPKDSPVASVAALKGKRIALTKGSSAQLLLMQLLAAAGLQDGDVKPMWLSPSDARAAFERGAVDAWVIWDPFLAVVQASSGARIVADGTGVVSTRSFYVTSHRYVEKNDDVLRATLAEIVAIDQWIDANRDKAAIEFARVWGLPREVVDVVLGRLEHGVEPVSRDVLAEQQRIADDFYALKLLPKKIDVRRGAPPSSG
jgi:sulfonate transport system substrate-binding protein